MSSNERGNVMAEALDRSAAAYAVSERPHHGPDHPARADAPQIGQHGQQQEEGTEQISSLAHPRYRFDAEGMKGEAEGRDDTAGCDSWAVRCRLAFLERREQQPTGDQVEQGRVGAMEQHVDEVIAAGIETAKPRRSRPT